MPPDSIADLNKTLGILEDIRDAAHSYWKLAKASLWNTTRATGCSGRPWRGTSRFTGEAMGRLAWHDPDTAARIGEHEHIIAFRNVLIHGYDLVDDMLVWSTIHEKLPPLLAEVENLLRNKQP